MIKTSMLKKILMVKSVSADRDNCLVALKIIKDELEKSKIPVSIKGRTKSPILIAGDQKNSRFLFLAHVDVVLGTDNQFIPKEEGDKLFARGAIDMKGPLVMLIRVFSELWCTGRREFVLVITSDEEIGGFSGIPTLFKNLKHFQLAIVPDTNTENIVICQKAPFHIKITKNNGVSAHGSTPWKGVNSGEAVSRCSLEIVGAVNKNRVDETSATITQIHSGSTINVIPDRAFSTIDIRIGSKKEIPKIIQKIDDIVEKNNCGWEKIDEPLIFKISPNNIFIKKWVVVFQKVTGKKPKLVVEPCASDARFFSQIGIPAVITSANGGGVHSAKEWVSKKSLEQFARVLFEFCQNL